MQLVLDFSPSKGAPCSSTDELFQGAEPLRPYQVSAFDGIKRELKTNRSTLLVMPTGCGKTRVFVQAAIEWPFVESAVSKRVLVLAHRDELLQQARTKLGDATGELIGLEQSDYYAGSERIVVSSIQTLSRENRLTRWRPNDFGLIIFDEAHHCPSPTWQRVYKYFSEAKSIGVTATPDRADETAMGTVFESVAYVYEIADAMKDGWLCPIVVRQVHVNEIDLSHCKEVAGDLSPAELDAIMAVEKVLHAVVRATIAEAGDRRTIVYTTSVDNTKRLAEMFNRVQPGSTFSVDGGTPIDLRRSLLDRFSKGGFQRLVNCGIATEGYNNPEVSCIAQARPTKSRGLHAQIIGRGLRICEGKKDCLVLEFTGNSGMHRLATSCDILGGNYPDEVLQSAVRIVKSKPGIRADVALKEAEEEERQKAAAAAAAAAAEVVKRAGIIANVSYSTFELDPFQCLHINSNKVQWSERFGGAIATKSQLDLLVHKGVKIPDGLTKQQAFVLIGALKKREALGLASYRQVQCLTRANIPALKLRFETANRLIAHLHSHGWKITPAEYQEIVSKGV